MELAMHETFEALFCFRQGVTVKQVDEFDAAHPEHGGLNNGDMSDCPYKRAHCFATAAERILAGEWNENWAEYDNELESLK